MRFREDDKYFSDEVVSNEQFWGYHELALKLLESKTIKLIQFGAHFQYATFTGAVKVFYEKRPNRNDKSLILKNDNWELECNPNMWKCIQFKPREILLEDEGLFIEFRESIWNEYQELKKKLEAKDE